MSYKLSPLCGTIALAELAVWAMPVSAVDFALRPSMTATNYIHVMPVENFSNSFAELIRNAARQSGAVQAAAARWHAEQLGVEVAAGAQLPSAALFGQAGVASGTMGNTPYSYGVRISVPIYDGNSAGYATEAQTSISAAARLSAMDELAATLVDLVAAAASIRRADGALEAHRAHLSSAKSLLAALASEQDVGTASQVDIDQVEAQLAQIEIELRVVDAARMQAQESFARIAGEAPATVGTIGSIAGLLPQNAAAAVTIGLAENPQLGNRLALASAAHSATRSVQASFGPEFSLDLSAGASGNLFASVSAPLDARAMFQLEIPFAFGTEAAVQQRALEAQAADFEAIAAEVGVAAGIESAYTHLQATRRSLSLAYDALERARGVLTGIEVERELGERSIFDVLTAQNGLAEARIRVSGLQYDITVAEHLLAAQLGRIDEIYGLALD